MRIILFALFALFVNAALIQQGSKWNYPPWGGVCTAKYVNGELWMHKDGVKSTKGTRIWKLSAAGSKKLQKKNNMVKVLWDNSAKLTAFMTNNNQIHVAHGKRLYVFQRVGTKGSCPKAPKVNLKKYFLNHKKRIAALKAFYRKHIKKVRSNYRKHVQKMRSNYRKHVQKMRSNYRKLAQKKAKLYQLSKKKLVSLYVKKINYYKASLRACWAKRRATACKNRVSARLRSAKYSVGVSKTNKWRHPVPWQFTKNGRYIFAKNIWKATYKCVRGKPRTISVVLKHKNGALDKFTMVFNRKFKAFTAYKGGKVYRYGTKL